MEQDWIVNGELSIGPDHELLCIIGCPRSGTTWLQLLLNHHPAVATVNETHIVSQFLGPMLRSWDRLSATGRDIGLAAVYSRPELVDRLRCLAHEAVGRIAEPDTRIVVEKTPDHALWQESLLEIFPDVRVVHLVRDPRDVTASLLAASREWGHDWAPDNVYDASWWWRDHVAGGRSFADHTARYRELRYEDLLDDTGGELRRLLEWVGLETPDEVIRHAVRDTQVSRMQKGRTKAPWSLEDEPPGFVRQGRAGSWREELSRSQARLVEHITGDLLREFDYGPEFPSSLPPVGLLRYWLRDRILERLS